MLLGCCYCLCRAQTVEQRFPALYEKYLAAEHLPSLFVDEDFLRRVGLYEQVGQCLASSQWAGLLTLQSETDVEDTCEFLASFTYEGCGEGKGIRYRHRGEWYHVLIEHVRHIFGWTGTLGDWGIYRPMELSDTWRWMTPDTRDIWSPSKVSARHIIRPLYFYLQQLFSHTLFGRDNGSDKPNKYEMAILIDISRTFPSDYGHYWGTYLRCKRLQGPIRCGGIITYYLRRMHQMPVLPDHRLIAPGFLDRRYFSAAKAIKYSATMGQIAWTYFRDPRYRQEVPRVRRRAGQADAVPPPPPVDPDIYQPPPTQDMLTLYFNLARVFQMVFPPGVQWVAPPPGWHVGMPVPPQYLVPGYQPRDDDRAD